MIKFFRGLMVAFLKGARHINKQGKDSMKFNQLELPKFAKSKLEWDGVSFTLEELEESTRKCNKRADNLLSFYTK